MALELGDKAACGHFGINLRTLQRWRKRANGDAELSQVVTTKKAELDAAKDEWAQEAVAFLRKAIAKLGELVEDAKPNQMRDVVGAIKIVGELDITRNALADECSTDAGETGKPAPGEGEDQEAESRGPNHGTREVAHTSPPLN